MRFRTLGRTGLSVSVIGFGASPLGDVFGAITQQQADDTVAAAIDAGINLVDVSPYYGETLAETRLGHALATRRDQVVLATKCGRYGAAHFDFSAATVVAEFENSLRRLRTTHVDILQLHDIEFGSIALIEQETLPALERLRAAGKVRFIGITGYWPGLLAQVAARTPVDTVLNYCHANLLMDDMDNELVPVARERNLGLMNASPLHMGLLSPHGAPSWHPAPPAVKAAASEIVAACERHHISPATVALHATLQHPAVASTFVGLKHPAEVEQALAALTFEPPTALAQEISRLAAPVFNTTWPSGLAENQPA